MLDLDLLFYTGITVTKRRTHDGPHAAAEAAERT